MILYLLRLLFNKSFPPGSLATVDICTEYFYWSQTVNPVVTQECLPEASHSIVPVFNTSKTLIAVCLAMGNTVRAAKLPFSAVCLVYWVIDKHTGAED